jgi:hypothetical protein
VASDRAVRLDWFEAEGLNLVEDALAPTEQDRRDVEGDLVDHVGDQCLADGRGPNRDVHALVPGAWRAAE